MSALVRTCSLCLLFFSAAAVSQAASEKTLSLMDNAPPVQEVPYTLLGRYTYADPECSGVLELLPAGHGYRAVFSTTCANSELCSETFFLDATPGPETGSLLLRDVSGKLELHLDDSQIRVPAGMDHLCHYGQGRMSGIYTKYTPPPLLLTERAKQLEQTLGQMREILAETRSSAVRENATGTPFPLGVQDAEISGLLMEAYLSNPSSRVPASSSRGQAIAALISYHRKVLNSIGFSLEMTMINAFAVRDFGYWGFLKISHRADVAAPYLAILDSPEVLKPLLEQGVISRQTAQGLIDFAPWYRTAFP